MMEEKPSSAEAEEKPAGLAKRVGSNVASAFFASLESCSCVNLTTADSDDEGDLDEEDQVIVMAHLQSTASDSSKTCPASVENLPV
ncbi:hypothetical protein Ccrd_014029 [Cynara cardunculus var. scolymus]|uniref:Uncharacterized protein n=1 Tax=Cynara cardunculus var. scolymus TaxID=59895 RepID=A0A103YEI3_CYNCS|nr:hypothetical protein Ccrd_014029 [Cynara cardunculus var. scolymus]